MTTRSHKLRTFAAGLGIAALAAVGAIAVAPAANAAPGDPSPSNITGTTGTLTIHKHAGDPGAAGPANGQEITDTAKQALLGAGLNGVVFSVQRVNYSGNPIDLTTSAGWDQAKNATPTNVSAAPFSLTAQTTANTDSTGQAVVPNLPYGLYLVTETSPGANPIVSPVQPFLVSVPYPNQGNWLYNVHVYPKNKLNTTNPQKTVADPATPVLGSNIVWSVNAPIPALAAGDTYRSFSITDNLDSRLTYVSAVLKVDGDTLTAGTDYKVDPNVKFTFLQPGLDKLAGKTAVTADITTTVTSLGADGLIKNTAIVNTNGSDRTTNTPQTNWGPLKVLKQDVTTKQTLKGAMFEVWTASDVTGTKVLGPIATDNNGVINVDGLWVGNGTSLSKDYWLKEIQAPAGYVLPANPWTKATVTANGSATPVTVTINNTQQTGPNLPLTGGSGSLLFTILGGVLVVAGVGTIILRRVRAKQH